MELPLRRTLVRLVMLFSLFRQDRLVCRKNASINYAPQERPDVYIFRRLLQSRGIAPYSVFSIKRENPYGQCHLVKGLSVYKFREADKAYCLTVPVSQYAYAGCRIELLQPKSATQQAML